MSVPDALAPSAPNGVGHDTDYDSPATPVNSAVPDLVKIDTEHLEPVSDVRHELKGEDHYHNLSVHPEVGTPIPPDVIPIHVPKGTPPPPTGQLLPEVEMAEQGIAADVTKMEENESAMAIDEPPTAFPPQSEVPSAASSVKMDADSPAPAFTKEETADASSPGLPEAGTSLAAATSSQSLRRSADVMGADEEQPAKRARVDSDEVAPEPELVAQPDAPSAPMANGSAANGTSTNGAPVIPPATNGHSLPPPSSAHTLNAAQWKFCSSTVRTLRKLKDASPFLRPVDPVALNIPHYFSIIKYPMDFSTVERKLAAANPAKPDPHPENPRYHNAEEFIYDVRHIFTNCITFNGPDHAVSQMGKRVEAVFDKQIKQLPPADEPKPLKKATPTPTPPPPTPTVKKPAPRRSSTSVPAIRRNENEAVSTRPKREIHPPPPKDLPYAEGPKKPPRKVRKQKDTTTTQQLQFCAKVLSELHKKQHWNIANPFYDPVDWVALNIPDYPKYVKKPMDLSTIRKKLEAHDYPNAQKFYDDFKLMIRNCFAFNPTGSPVNQAGVELQRLFDDKWKQLPQPQAQPGDGSEDEEEEEEEEEDETARTIAQMENQIELMRGNIEMLKGNGPKPKEKKKKKEKVDKPYSPVASTSKAPPKAKAAAPTKKKGSKKAVPDDDVLSFDQKKELSEAIANLDGTKLERVIQIIHEGVPEIRDSTEEIELEIDTLPSQVLMKLYNFVLRPLKAGPKRSRVPKGGGTGGLKRKSMDETVEAEKIRQLEERMRMFDQGGQAAEAAQPAPARDSESDSSSDDSSGSESD